MKKDDQLNQIFDAYADEFPQQQQNLTNKARAQMQKSRKTKLTFKVLAGVLCCLVVCLISISVFNNIMDNFGDVNDNKNDWDSSADESVPPSSSAQEVQMYARKDLTGKYCDLSDVQVVNLQSLHQQLGIVEGAKYYAFYNDADQLVCYVATFAVVGENGIAEVSLIVEKDGFVRSDLSNAYNQQMSTTLNVYQTVSQNGEYVTMAFLQQQGFHCYMQIAGDQSVSDKIATIIFS